MTPANNHVHPDQPYDPQHEALEALLAEEAALNHAPADLEAKVLELTDPQLLSLLDEALAPQAETDRLSERIIAATSPQAQQTTATTTHAKPQRAVLGRIDPAGWRYAAAAAIVLATGVGLWWTGQHAAIESSTPQFTDLILDWEQQDETQPLFAELTDDLDTTLNAVAERIDDYAEREDSIWSDMDGYEDFLTALDPQT